MEHTIHYEPDTIYRALARPYCSCGWGKAGFVKHWLAERYADEHLDASLDALLDQYTHPAAEMS